MKTLTKMEPMVVETQPTWSFTILLDREPTDDEFNAMYDAGLDDSSISDEFGEHLMGMDREAPSLFAAIISSVRDLRSMNGPRPIGVRFDDSVTLSDISLRLHGTRTAESLRLLAAGKRGPGGFPPPRLDTGKLRVYSWAQVATWLRDVLGDDVPDSDPDLALADAALRLAEWARVTNRTDEIKALMEA
jgi:hypothetical protein